jgi:hypothetical protein
MLYPSEKVFNMNINVYLEDPLAKSLNQYAKKSGTPRNAIIREAVKEWIIHHEVKQWPKSILTFKGLTAIPSFESYRTDLLPSDDENPLR